MPRLGTLGLLSIALGALAGCCAGRTVSQSALVPVSEVVPMSTAHGGGELLASVSGLTATEADGAAGLGHYVAPAELHLATGLHHRVFGARLFGGAVIPAGAQALDADAPHCFQPRPPPAGPRASISA